MDLRMLLGRFSPVWNRSRTLVPVDPRDLRDLPPTANEDDLRRCLGTLIKDRSGAAATERSLDEDGLQAIRALGKEPHLPSIPKQPRTDDNLELGDESLYPMRSLGWLQIRCTGMLVGPRHVLTAAHCLHELVAETFYFYNSFHPGRHCQLKPPYGSYRIEKCLVPAGWVESYHAFDFGMAILDRAIYPPPPTLGLRVLEPPDRGLIIGYPGNNVCQYYTECTFQTGPPPGLWIYDSHATDGMSGGPCLSWPSELARPERFAIGIHGGLHASGKQRAARWTEETLGLIKSWIRDH